MSSHSQDGKDGEKGGGGKKPGGYIPPHKRKTGGTASLGTLMPLGSTKATALRDWLNGLPAITAILIGRNSQGDDVMQLNQLITMDGAARNVRYNVHLATGLGSTWIEGVHGVSINAQDNTRGGTMLALWQAATVVTTTATTPSSDQTGS